MSSSFVTDVVYGSIAGVVGKVVEFPFDTIKVRLQTQPLTPVESSSTSNSQLHSGLRGSGSGIGVRRPASLNVNSPTFSGPIDVLMKTIKAEGFFGLYKGISAPIVGAMVENSGLFLCYNQIQSFVRFMSNLPESSPLSLLQLSACGFLSGAVVSCALTPIELIKCKLQVQGLNKHVSAVVRPTYTGPFHIVKHIFKTEGIKGFYRGHLGTLLRESGGGAFWFGTYELGCKIMMDRAKVATKDDLSPWQLMTAGAFAGMAFNFSLYPADVVKSRQQTAEVSGHSIAAPKKLDFVSVAREIYASQGIKGFYRGAGITVLRSAPTSGAIFMTYELLRRNIPL